MELGLAVIVGIATIVNAIALIYDVIRRHKVTLVNFVQVPNQNGGGFEEFKTNSRKNGSGQLADYIKINSDNTVEITMGGQVRAYGRYIRWQKD